MIPYPFYLNCMDPGRTTGLGLLRIECDSFTVEETASVVYADSNPARVLESWRHQYSDVPHILVYENFTIRPGRVKPDTTAIDVISNVMTWILDQGVMSEDAKRVLAWVNEKAKFAKSPEAIALLSALRDEVSGYGSADSPYEEIVKQEPVHAKNIATDPVLDRLGLKLIRHDDRHINDAFRHAAAYLAQQRYMPVCSRGWPRSGALPHNGFTSER